MQSTEDNEEEEQQNEEAEFPPESPTEEEVPRKQSAEAAVFEQEQAPEGLSTEDAALDDDQPAEVEQEQLMERTEVKSEETETQPAHTELGHEPSPEDRAGQQEPSTEEAEAHPDPEQPAKAELEQDPSTGEAESQQAEEPKLPRGPSTEEAELQSEEAASQQEQLREDAQLQQDHPAEEEAARPQEQWSEAPPAVDVGRLDTEQPTGFELRPTEGDDLPAAPQSSDVPNDLSGLIGEAVLKIAPAIVEPGNDDEATDREGPRAGGGLLGDMIEQALLG
jgi:hypothetical protein